MAFNALQKDFIAELKSRSTQLKDMYGYIYNLKESFDENFSNGQTNALNDAGDADELLESYGLIYSDIQAFFGQSADVFIKYYTNQAISSGDYGKYIRKMANP